jgi:hypothetical protein
VSAATGRKAIVLLQRKTAKEEEEKNRLHAEIIKAR